MAGRARPRERARISQHVWGGARYDGSPKLAGASVRLRPCGRLFARRGRGRAALPTDRSPTATPGCSGDGGLGRSGSSGRPRTLLHCCAEARRPPDDARHRFGDLRWFRGPIRFRYQSRFEYVASGQTVAIHRLRRTSRGVASCGVFRSETIDPGSPCSRRTREHPSARPWCSGRRRQRSAAGLRASQEAPLCWTSLSNRDCTWTALVPLGGACATNDLMNI